MTGSSWVVHCGSQCKSPGQSNVDFDLNLNQTLEFADDTRCSIMNLCIPTSVPNVLDSFDNRTWKFKFRLYALPSLPAGTVTSNSTANKYTVTTTSFDTAVLHSEYEMVVSIPEGSYQQSDAEANFTESTNTPQVAGCVRSPIRINFDASLVTDPVGPTVGPNYSAALMTTSVPLDDNGPWHQLLNSELLIPSHRYGINGTGRNRTYAEALQYAIWHTQQNIRFSVVKGTDVVPTTKLSTWTEPNVATASQLVANETYKLRILKMILSECNITVNTNANHQLDFIFRTNLVQNTDLASNLHHYFGNLNFMTPQFNSLGTFAGGASSGALTTYRQLNPWACVATGGGLTIQDGSPTHMIQVQITPPSNIRFKSRTISNCLDYYQLRYRQTLSTSIGTNNILFTSMDNHWKSSNAVPVPSAAITENQGMPSDLTNNTPFANTGNFTPYGLTWTGCPVTSDRTDGFRKFSVQDGTDGWIPLAYFGVKNPETQVASNLWTSQGVFMYAPLFEPSDSFSLQYINDVQCNRFRDTGTNGGAVEFCSATAPAAYPNAQVVGHNLALYPPTGRPSDTVSGARAEFISGVFTGYSVFVTSAQIISPSLSSFGAANLIGNLYNLHAMDAESHPTFIVEIEMLGIGNHMKFTGSGECKRTKIVKRVPLSGTSYGGFLRANADAQEVVDYGTCIGLSRVSSIKCRILNEKGEVLKLSQPDTFPPWSFSLCFEC